MVLGSCRDSYSAALVQPRPLPHFFLHPVRAVWFLAGLLTIYGADLAAYKYIRCYLSLSLSPVSDGITEDGVPAQERTDALRLHNYHPPFTP